MSPRTLALAAALLASATPAAAASPDGSCAGTLSGAVRASFACTATLSTERGQTVLVITADEPVAGVKRLQPARYEIPGEGLQTGPVEPLGPGESIVETAGKPFHAADASLTLDQLERLRGGGYMVSGTFRARLVNGSGAEVQLEVQF